MNFVLFLRDELEKKGTGYRERDKVDWVTCCGAAFSLVLPFRDERILNGLVNNMYIFSDGSLTYCIVLA